MADRAPALDWEQEFPILQSGRLHLNHSGVSPLTRRAADALVRYAREASEEMGTVNAKWYARLDEVRAQAARLMNADSEEIVFANSTTHGLLIVANSVAWKSGQAIVVEENTFPANWYVWKALEARCGVRVLVWPERDLRYEIAGLEALLRDNPVQMVALSAVDYATGFRHDLEAIGALCRNAGALFCIDGIQALGAVPVDVRACGADFLSADSHKWLLGPEGAGLLFVRRERIAELSEAMVGWIGRQNFTDYEARDLAPDPTARRFEPGAYNHAGLHAMGESIRLLNDFGMGEVHRRLRARREELVAGVEETGWQLASPRGESDSAGIASFRHATLDAEQTAKRLVGRGIICTARRGMLRLAPHFYQSPEHMQRVVREVGSLRTT